MKRCLFLLSSLSETFAKVTFAAMASGLAREFADILAQLTRVSRAA